MRLVHHFFLLLFFMLLTASAAAQEKTRRVAVTIDDLPYSDLIYLSPAEAEGVVDNILKALENHEITATGFIIGSNVKRKNKILIDKFVQAGHTVGNHSNSHISITSMTAREFIADIQAAQSVVDEWRKDGPKYFRYPFFQRGETKAKKDSVQKYLLDNGYLVVPSTMGTYDWDFSNECFRAYERGDNEEVRRLGNEYLDRLDKSITEAEMAANYVAGGPVDHILIIHMNFLNSLYLDELFSKLEAEGWEFITLEEAMQHEVYHRTDNYVGYLAHPWLFRLTY